MKRHLHAALVLLAVPVWAVAMLLLALCLLLVVLADRVWPEAYRGNCWSYVGPKWKRFGGYLQIRMADFPKVFGRRIIPHVQWVHALHPDTRLHQTEPVHRHKRLRDAWRTAYFEFRVDHEERKPRVSDWADLDAPWPKLDDPP